MFEIWGVRYQVKDVDRSITFYIDNLGFKLAHQAGSMFAAITNSGLKLFLSGAELHVEGNALRCDLRK